MSYSWIPHASNIRYYSDSDDDSNENDSSIISSTASIDEFSEYLIDSDSDDEISDRIYNDDESTVEAIKTNGTYYLGCVCKCLLLEMIISPRILYKYTYRQIREYMLQYSVSSCCRLYGKKPTVDIIVLDIQDEVYHAVIKTFWIRLVQRHWKKTYKQQRDILKLRKSWENQRHFQLHGRYITGSNYTPSLRGMMAQYSS
jgi:hypothetical protein